MPGFSVEKHPECSITSRPPNRPSIPPISVGLAVRIENWGTPIDFNVCACFNRNFPSWIHLSSNSNAKKLDFINSFCFKKKKKAYPGVPVVAALWNNPSHLPPAVGPVARPRLPHRASGSRPGPGSSGVRSAREGQMCRVGESRSPALNHKCLLITSEIGKQND